MDDRHDVQRYTGVIAHPRDMLEKLWFNIEVFKWALSRRDGGEAQGFAILDYAQASRAMHAWVCAAVQEGDGRNVSKELEVLPWAQAFAAIANGTKHVNAPRKEWPEGELAVRFFADDDAVEALEHDLANLDWGAAGFLGAINDGSAWGEGVLADGDHPAGVKASKAMVQNFEAWQAILKEHDLA